LTRISFVERDVLGEESLLGLVKEEKAKELSEWGYGIAIFAV
jgi:hypothetical protein